MELTVASDLSRAKVKYRVKLEAPLNGRPIHVWLTDKIEVMVVPLEQGVKIVSSICPHMGAQLSWNEKTGEVSCPWHGLVFEGKSLKSCHPRYRKISEFEGAIIEGELLVYEANA